MRSKFPLLIICMPKWYFYIHIEYTLTCLSCFNVYRGHGLQVPSKAALAFHSRCWFCYQAFLSLRSLQATNVFLYRRFKILQIELSKLRSCWHLKNIQQVTRGMSNCVLMLVWPSWEFWINCYHTSDVELCTPQYIVWYASYYTLFILFERYL